MPSRNHSRVANNLGNTVDQFKDRFELFPQLNLNLEGWRTIPDFALYPQGALPKDWTSDDEEVSQVPLVIFEILSPKQNLQPLVDKIRTYLKHGVSSCWLIVPATRTATIFNASGDRTFVEGIVRDDTVGLEVPHSAIFA